VDRFDCEKCLHGQGNAGFSYRSFTLDLEVSTSMQLKPKYRAVWQCGERDIRSASWLTLVSAPTHRAPRRPKSIGRNYGSGPTRPAGEPLGPLLLDTFVVVHYRLSLINALLPIRVTAKPTIAVRAKVLALCVIFPDLTILAGRANRAVARHRGDAVAVDEE
jgi:hypothetical protein